MTVIVKWASSAVGKARKSLRRWRLQKWEVSGKERYSGLPLSLAYFGHDFGFRTVLQKMFTRGYNTRRTGRAWLGTPGFPLTPTNLDSDIVAIELDPVRWQAHDTGSGFLLPLWSQTNIMVANAYDQMKRSGSLKEDLRRIRKNKIVCETSRESADLRMYYEKMYFPYITGRHGDLSLPDSWEKIVETEKRGELILAGDSAGNSIGGIVLERTTEKLSARSLGLISKEKDILRTGVMSALYLACFERAKSYGYDSVGFGLTGPFLNDGLLRFKKKWGLQLVNRCQQGIWLQFNKATSAVESFLINNPFICRHGGKLHGVTFIADSESTDSERLRTLHSLYYLTGMESLHICAIKPGSGLLTIPETLKKNLVWGTNRTLYTRAI